MRPTGGGDPCPTDAERAALVKGTLDSSKGREVALHVLTCERCREQVRAPATRGSSSPRWVAVALGILLTVVVGASVVALRQPAGKTRNPGMDELVEATGEQRLVEGRLSGGFVWAPVSVTRGPREEGGGGRWKIAGVAARIEERGHAKLDTHALGVAHLLLGNTASAIDSFERAAGRSPNSAEVLSDWAAALIELGKEPDRAWDLVQALDLSQRATVLAPDQPEPWFNKAVALEALGLRKAAAHAWGSYITLDADSSWTVEARTRRLQLQTDPEGAWSEQTANFRRACSDRNEAEVERLVRVHPQDATEAVLSDLGRWSRLKLDADPAADELARCMEVAAKAVRIVTGDVLLEEAAKELRLEAANPGRIVDLAKAHEYLHRGRTAQDELRVRDANRDLSTATTLLSALGSPVEDLADLYRLSSAYYIYGSETVLPDVGDLIERARARKHYCVEARSCWLRGLALSSVGSKGPALDELRRAYTGLERVRFAADAIFVQSLVAETTWLLGRYAESWEVRRASFRTLDNLSDPRRAQVVLGSAAFEANLEGKHGAALALQEAALMLARSHASVPDRCDAIVWFARTAQEAGLHSAAESALVEGRASAEEVLDRSLRRVYQSELDIVEGKLRAVEAPDQAVAILDRALSATTKEDRRLEILFTRARAHETAGRWEDASRDYLGALTLAERQRQALDDPYLRISLFDTMAQMAREVVRSEFDRGDTRRALILADRIRSASLANGDWSSDGLQRLLDRLRTDQALVVFHVLEDRLVVWVLRRATLWTTALSISSSELQWVVDGARDAIIGSPRVSDTRDQQLFERVIGPLRDRLAGAREVVLVPDGTLHLVPWGALRDPRTRRRWIEDVALAVAPSLGTVARSASPGAPRTAPRLLAVGNPAFDRNLYPNLPDLPEAGKEALEVAALYSRSTVLVDEAATADRFLEEAKGAEVLHVAAHAISHGIDPELSTLVLAPAGTRTADGALASRDILHHDMGHVRMVVLAACRTGDGPVSRIEGPLGVARPFLENGARSVVVTLWDFPDRGGRGLATSLHRAVLEGIDAMKALQRAEKECWASRDADPRSCGSLQLILNESWGG